MRCVDWRLDRMDWARPLFHGSKAHYTCWVGSFWVSARCVGYTPRQAAKRALKLLNRRDLTVPRATDEELDQI